MLAVAEPAAAAIEAARPRLLSLLQALQADGSPPPTRARPATIDPAGEVAALQELAALLENSDMRATEVMTQLLQQQGPDMGPDWRALDDAVAGLDFERALRLCRSLLTEDVA